MGLEVTKKPAAFIVGIVWFLCNRRLLTQTAGF